MLSGSVLFLFVRQSPPSPVWVVPARASDKRASCPGLSRYWGLSAILPSQAKPVHAAQDSSGADITLGFVHKAGGLTGHVKPASPANARLRVLAMVLLSSWRICPTAVEVHDSRRGSAPRWSGQLCFVNTCKPRDCIWRHGYIA